MNEFEYENMNGVATDMSDGSAAAPDMPVMEPQVIMPAASAEQAYPDQEMIGGVYFTGDATPDGMGYSTPNGGHGYAYAPVEEQDHKKKRGRFGRTMAIIGIVVGGIALTVGAFFGTIFILNEVYGLDALIGDRGNFGGYNGDLIIEDESDSEESSTQQDPSGNHGAGISGGEEVSPPENATIDKSEPLRKDEDGDGKADYAYGEDGQVLTSADGSTLSAATVVAKVADSVVEITTEQVQSNWFGQYVTSGAGSGVVISPEGYIVTNNHVVEGASSITVRLTDGSEYQATLVGTDARSDIAVIWIDAGDRELTVAQLGSSYDLVVGEDILAIGNPMGSLGGTVTYGKVSATAREITVDNTLMTLLQIDAPINPGNSGGALFNMAGQLVGIVNAKMSSTGIEGLGFAIPVDTAYRVIVDLIDHGYVKGRPALGMTLQIMQNQVGQYYLSVVEAPYNDQVKAGDVIASIGGTKVSTFADVTAVLSGYSVGDEVELVLYRKNQTLTVTVTLREYVPA